MREAATANFSLQRPTGAPCHNPNCPTPNSYNAPPVRERRKPKGNGDPRRLYDGPRDLKQERLDKRLASRAEIEVELEKLTVQVRVWINQ